MEPVSDNDSRSESSETTGTSPGTNGQGREYEADVLACAQVLDEHKARDTVALYISEVCSFTDYLVVATANSVAHARGLQKQLQVVFEERGIQPLSGTKRQDDNTWTLIDLGFAVINIMTDESRTFYELERLWFAADEIYSSAS